MQLSYIKHDVCHVALTATEPDVTKENVIERDLTPTTGGCDVVRTAGFNGVQVDFPHWSTGCT